MEGGCWRASLYVQWRMNTNAYLLLCSCWAWVSWQLESGPGQRRTPSAISPGNNIVPLCSYYISQHSYILLLLCFSNCVFIAQRYGPQRMIMNEWCMIFTILFINKMQKDRHIRPHHQTFIDIDSLYHHVMFYFFRLYFLRILFICTSGNCRRNFVHPTIPGLFFFLVIGFFVNWVFLPMTINDTFSCWLISTAFLC